MDVINVSQLQTGFIAYVAGSVAGKLATEVSQSVSNELGLGEWGQLFVHVITNCVTCYAAVRIMGPAVSAPEIALFNLGLLSAQPRIFQTQEVAWRKLRLDNSDSVKPFTVRR